MIDRPTAAADLSARANRRLVPGSQNFIAFSDAPELPRFVARAEGPYIWDCDGHRYIDLYGGSGANILGHAHPVQIDAVRRRLADGPSVSLRHPLEIELAEWLARALPWAERSIFFKTGSEAVHAAVTTALRQTGRSLTLSFGYHGWLPPFVPFPPGSEAFLVSVRGWDLDAAVKAIRAHAADLGVVIVGPDPAMLDPAFYRAVRDETSRAGAVFVMDEIKSGFRLRFPTAANAWELDPDLHLVSKAFSNGFPIAALTGRDRLLGRTDNLDLFSTFAGETLSLVAAMTCVEQLAAGAYAAFERATNQLYQALARRLSESPISLVGDPTYFRLVFPGDEAATMFSRALAGEHILLHPSDCVILSAAHDDQALLQDIADVCERVAKTINR